MPPLLVKDEPFFLKDLAQYELMEERTCWLVRLSGGRVLLPSETRIASRPLAHAFWEEGSAISKSDQALRAPLLCCAGAPDMHHEGRRMIPAVPERPPSQSYERALMIAVLSYASA